MILRLIKVDIIIGDFLRFDDHETQSVHDLKDNLPNNKNCVTQ